jgi:hypothetical protein
VRPIGNQRMVRRALGFRERNIRELELRVALASHETGVCDEELPLFTRAYKNNVPQPDHGYRPANRRKDTVPRPPGRLSAR